MAADHSLHQCQIDASAMELGFTMQSLKGTEQLADIGQSNPAPLSRTKKMVESASSMQPTVLIRRLGLQRMVDERLRIQSRGQPVSP